MPDLDLNDQPLNQAAKRALKKLGWEHDQGYLYSLQLLLGYLERDKQLNRNVRNDLRAAVESLLGEPQEFAQSFLLESEVKGDVWNPEPSLKLPPLELAATLGLVLHSKLAAVKPDFPVRSGNPVPTR